MLLYNQFICERFVNIFDSNNKEQYLDEVWNLLQIAYKIIGGFQSVTSKNELLNTAGLWKLVRKDNKIIACTLYKDQFGKKCYAVASDSTFDGKKALLKILEEDLKFDRSWYEVSGKLESIMKKHKAYPIPVDIAEKILNKTGKILLSKNTDGYHYTRLINGNPHEKIMFGKIEDFDY